MNYSQYKLHFQKELTTFVKKLKQSISIDNGEWSIKGFVDVYKNIYTISVDTKIISKILEIHIFPQILDFANKNNYHVILPEHQNYYPDLTFIHKDNKNIKFAVDLKTTYRKKNKIATFTLGSHGSYFKERDKKKNIQFPYNEYLGHFCLGVIYTRSEENTLSETEIYQIQELQDNYSNTINFKHGQIKSLKNLKSITSVIKDFDFFVAEKWKIASDKQGSGNTANIGCSLSIDDLKNERGIFSNLGEEWFDEYWINFNIATMMKNDKIIKITNLKDFLEFKGRKDLLNKINIQQGK